MYKPFGCDVMVHTPSSRRELPDVDAIVQALDLKVRGEFGGSGKEVNRAGRQA